MSKTAINELEVNGETYVLKGSVKAEPKNSNIKIAILQRGWVRKNNYERHHPYLTYTVHINKIR